MNDYILVIDENGRETIMETGITKGINQNTRCYSDYYRECNPTKQFELL